MKYESFEINNYRGINHVLIKLGEGGNISTLVGLNESGKTTVLEAMYLLQRDISEAKRHTLIPKSKKRNFNEPVSVKAELSLSDQDEEEVKRFASGHKFNLEQQISKITIEKVYKFERSRHTGATKSITVSLVGRRSRASRGTAKDLATDDSIRGEIESFILNNLVPPIIFYPNFLYTFPDKIYLESYSAERSDQGFYRSVLQDVLDSLGEGLKLQEHVLDRLKSGNEDDKEALSSTLLSMGEKITRTVIKGWDALFASANKEITLATGEYRTEEGEPRYYIEMKLNEGSEPYQITERSLGFRWFFAFILFTEFRKEREADKGEILFLVDEPASNLHSTAQAKLTSVLERLVDKSKLIYTTHSHHLINPGWLEAAFIVKNSALEGDDIQYTANSTDISVVPYRQFAAEHPDQSSYFQPILDRLDYKPSKLEMVPDIIVVEGKNDFYTLKYMQKIAFPGEFDDLHFYPGRGAGGNEDVIRLYVGWGRGLLVLLDSDTAGTTEKQRYIDEIGEIVKDSIFTLGDVQSSWTGKQTEGLFSQTEQIRVMQTVDSSANRFKKKKFNSAVQQALFSNQPLNLTETTINRFRKICIFLKSQQATPVS